jgi:hypothetical protein
LKLRKNDESSHDLSKSFNTLKSGAYYEVGKLFVSNNFSIYSTLLFNFSSNLSFDSFYYAYAAAFFNISFTCLLDYLIIKINEWILNYYQF